MSSKDMSQLRVIERTKQWVQTAVVGLGLCPFAAALVFKGNIRYTVCWSESEEDWLEQMLEELAHLQSVESEVCETTLMMAPNVLADFAHFNLFLQSAHQTLKRKGYAGQFQIAHFHPQYCFYGVPPLDPSNNTNKAPYPTLHLLRESALDQAATMTLDIQSLLKRNQDKLTELGHEGFAELAKAWSTS